MWEAALELVSEIPRRPRISLAADKGYEVAGFVGELRQRDVTPNVARNNATAKISSTLSHPLAHLVDGIPRRAASRDGTASIA